jgi:hypothetical protein
MKRKRKSEMNNKSSTNLSAPIVGSVFRPPALTIIQSLPFGTPLVLQREPENPYDSSAIKVLLPGFSPEGLHSSLFQEALASAIPDHAELSKGQFYSGSLSDPFHLGYIGAKTGHAALLAKMMDENGAESLSATLSAGLTGQPIAEFTLKSKELENAVSE